MAYYEQWIQPYEKVLEEYANEIGLYDSKRKIKLAEAYSRKAGEEIIWDINRGVEISQKNLKCRYDIINYSGRSAVTVEVKCRGNSIDTYPTTDISAKKGDYITDKSGWLIVFFNESREYLVFDLEHYHPPVEKWEHKKTTAMDTDEMVVEDKYCFDPSKAIYSGVLDKEWITRGGYGRH